MTRGDEKLMSSRYDKDAGRWRPYSYGLNLDVPVDADDSVEGTINLMNCPFVMNRVTHGVVGNTNDYLGTGLADDGQYWVSWKEEFTEYQNQPLLAKEAFGTRDYPLLLPSPIGWAGNKVLTFRVQSAYTRILIPEAETFEVNLVIHGIIDFGPLRGN